MLKNYFKIAWRNLLKDRQFTLLNLLGLSTGLACVLLIHLWVTDELLVDKFHENDNRLYQVMEREQASDGISVSYRTSALTAPMLKQEMPEVENATAVMHYSWFPKFEVFAAANQKLKAAGQFADQGFFNVFSYPLLHGDKKTALSETSAIAVSDQLALKLFNTADIVGKTVQWELGGFKGQAAVSAVFSIPANSSEQFDFILPFDVFKEMVPAVVEWGNNGTNAYIVLKQGTDVAQFSNKIAGFIKTKKPDTGRNLFLKKFSDNYLYAKYENGVQSGGRIEYVQLFTIVAIFILVIACINFMNLSTAKASRRLKEVGIKKVVGARRSSLILQYMSESVLMAAISLATAMVLVSGFLPQFNAITSKNIVLEWDTSLVLTILGITVLTGILSGSYPALYLSGFRPIAVLKGKIRTSAGELWVRKGLVVFQFTLSVVFIISVIVVYKQMEMIQSKNLGYDKENVIYFNKEGGARERSEHFLAELKKIPGIINAAATDHRFAKGLNSTGDVKWPGKTPEQNISFEIVHATYDLIETLGIEMKAGRSYSRDFGTDSTRIIFNEAAISVMGLKDPVGKRVNLWGEEREILGVMKNFHFESLHQEVKPLFVLLAPQHTQYVIAKMGAGRQDKVLTSLKELYGKYNPGSSFDYA
ncbi:MAG TPA: ABC transporter permease, partial [Chitinophagaceae bacterium]|nr:ABC transporter permease [Chitinophagaceae bacterium]